MSVKAEWCIHYDGIVGRAGEPGPRERRCKAGVLYDSVRQPGSIPCISQGDAECALREYPTAEQIAERNRRIEASGQEMLRRLADEECIHCGTKVMRYVEVRPCVYAEPCGHRQWQGRAPASTRSRT